MERDQFESPSADFHERSPTADVYWMAGGAVGIGLTVVVLAWWLVGAFGILCLLAIVLGVGAILSDGSDYQGRLGCSSVVALLIAGVVWFLPGWLSPPIDIEFRTSRVGIGMVARLDNDSAHHLYNVKVVGRDIKSVSSGSVQVTEHLRPRGSVEVGWMEFEGWVPMPGESIEVYCDGYFFPAVAVVPADSGETDR